MRSSGYRRPPALVRRSDGQVLQLTRLLYLVLEAIDGRRTLEEIAREVSDSYGRRVRPQDVRHLVEDRLRPLGTLQLTDGSEPQVAAVRPLLALRFRYAVSDPETTRRVTAPFAWLFHPAIVVVVVGAFFAICGWVLFSRGLGFATYQAFRDPVLLLVVLAITLATAGFHEFGHAAAARYGGATPGTMGMGLYILWPAFYTDVTDSYRLSRTGRIRTDLGGVYFNAVATLVIFGCWWLTGWDALLLAIATQLLQIIRQMPPLLRFDGYHLLADVTGVPDLYYRIKPTLLSLWPTRWGSTESKVLKPWAKAVVTGWVVLVVPFMLGSVLLTVVTLPRILATATSSTDRQWHSMVRQFGHGDVPAGLAKLVGVIAVVLPVAGACYMLVRTTRRVVSRMWQGTTGRPTWRAGVVVLCCSVAGALTLAWWPHGNYRPIQPYERGTIEDALPASFRQALPSPLLGGVPTVSTGSPVTMPWPASAGPLPTAAHPVLALVLTPKSPTGGTARPTRTWVFPFDRPPPPGPGDNQALAINTTNGSTLYQVAFALVWADGSQPVLNRNSAYAYASCFDCRTTAVAFQVVLVIGDAHVVVPQNEAGALNDGCVSCLTQALAQQLVLTLPGAPSPQEIGTIEAIWRQISAWATNLQGLSDAEIESALQRYEDQIKAVVGADNGSTATATTTSTTSPPPSTTEQGDGSGGPTPDGSPAPAGSSSDTPTSTTSIGTPPSTTSTSEPTTSTTTQSDSTTTTSASSP